MQNTIVASGIKRVVYVEPYPKSRALDLHGDSIYLSHEAKKEEKGNDKEVNNEKVLFEPFVGIGHRRFFDLFSMKLSTGIKIKREEKGEKVKWSRENNASLRVPLIPLSYIEKEGIVVTDLKYLEFYKESIQPKKHN